MRYLAEHPIIDFYVIKEGEIAFANLISLLIKSDLDVEAIRTQLPSVHSIGKDGTAHLNGEAARLKNLTEIPSPYLDGRMDEFFDGRLMPILQTNRGCPFSCTFCVEGRSYYNKIYKNDSEKVTTEIDYIARHMAALREQKGRNDFCIADSNFGMFKTDLETCGAIAKAQKEHGWPDYIIVATGKNQKARVLEAASLVNGAMRISGSVQSLDEDVLSNVKRSNISADGLLDLALSAQNIGLNSYSEIILALPGDTKAKHYDTLKKIIDAGFSYVTTYQLMMLPGTDLCTDDMKERFHMVLRYRILPRCYARYQILGEQVSVAEIEEICVANNSLSLEDYVECRMMSLVITIFHNDGVFGALLKYLRNAGLSVYRWMELIQHSVKSGALGKLFEQYKKDTVTELWSDRAALEKFITEPQVIDQFLDGSLGNNLLFVYKSRAVTLHVTELAELARETFVQLLTEQNVLSPEAEEFVSNAVSYHSARMMHLFRERDRAVRRTFRYDIRAFDKELRPGSIAKFRLENEVEARFELTLAQRELIERNLAVWGDNAIGIGRVLSRVYVGRLLRNAVYDQSEAIVEDRVPVNQ